MFRNRGNDPSASKGPEAAAAESVENEQAKEVARGNYAVMRKDLREDLAMIMHEEGARLEHILVATMQRMTEDMRIRNEQELHRHLDSLQMQFERIQSETSEILRLAADKGAKQEDRDDAASETAASPAAKGTAGRTSTSNNFDDDAHDVNALEDTDPVTAKMKDGQAKRAMSPATGAPGEASSSSTFWRSKALRIFERQQQGFSPIYYLAGLQGWRKTVDKYEHLKPKPRTVPVLVDAIFSAVILLNAIFAGVRVQMQSNDPPAGTEWQEVCSLAFVIVFFVEFVVRLAFYRRAFFTSEQWKWNLLDTILIVSALVELVASEMNLNGTAFVLRTCRVLRFARLARVLTKAAMFEQLRLLIAGFAGAALSFAWACGFLLVTMYFFALILCDGYLSLRDSTFSADDDVMALQMWFGSLDKGILSLIMAVTFGVTWKEILDTLSPAGDVYPYVFILYIVVVLLFELNLLSGIFVHSISNVITLVKRSEMADEWTKASSVMGKMEAKLTEIGEGIEGLCSFENVLEACEDEEFLELFADLDLDIAAFKSCFRMLDTEERNRVPIVELVGGIFRISTVEQITPATLMYENKRLVESWITAMADMERMLSCLDGEVAAVKKAITNESQMLKAPEPKLENKRSNSPSRKAAVR